MFLIEFLIELIYGKDTVQKNRRRKQRRRR